MANLHDRVESLGIRVDNICTTLTSVLSRLERIDQRFASMVKGLPVDHSDYMKLAKAKVEELGFVSQNVSKMSMVEFIFEVLIRLKPEELQETLWCEDHGVRIERVGK